MPAFPVGVETCQIIYGKGISPTGNAQKAQLQVDLILGGSAQAVVWAGDGTPLLKLVDVFTLPAGEMGAATVAVVDQEGWLDGSGASFSMWAYRLTERVAGGVVRVKYVQPLSGQMSIDFDMIPDGNVGLPVSAPVVPVTSVNGQTGAVTVDGASDPGVAAFIEDDSSDTYAAIDAAAAALLTTPGTALNIWSSQITDETARATAAEDQLTASKADAANPVFTGTVTVPDGALAIADTSGLQAALDLKAPLASPAFTGTVTGVTKAMVGLGSADNTSDASKPVSTAQQAAIASFSAAFSLVFGG